MTKGLNASKELLVGSAAFDLPHQAKTEALNQSSSTSNCTISNRCRETHEEEYEIASLKCMVQTFSYGIGETLLSAEIRKLVAGHFGIPEELLKGKEHTFNQGNMCEAKGFDAKSRPAKENVATASKKPTGKPVFSSNTKPRMSKPKSTKSRKVKKYTLIEVN